MKKIILFFVLIILLISFLFIPKKINKGDIDVARYINIVDEISDNYVQINWKYVVSIIAVLEKNKLSNVDDSYIESISKKFLIKKDDTYILNTLDNVLDLLDMTEKQKSLVYKYLNQLEFFGLYPNKLKPDTKYYDFINSIKEMAIKNYKDHKILPSITISQAILESGWGDSDLSKKYNNLFGIKANSSWEGDFVTVETSEFYNQKIQDKFRKYYSKEESINDHSKFLVENPRYRENGVFDANTYIYQANALEKAGYSTIENEKGEKIYADKLIELIRQYNLQLIDSMVQENLK